MHIIRKVTKTETTEFKSALAQLFQEFLLSELEYLNTGGYPEWGDDIYDLTFTPLENGHLDFYLNNTTFYVVVESKLPIAMVGYSPEHNSLVWFYVSPEHQRQGLGRRLYRHVVEQHELTKLNLVVKPNNHKAIEFYKSLGLLTSSIIMTVNMD